MGKSFACSRNRICSFNPAPCRRASPRPQDLVPGAARHPGGRRSEMGPPDGPGLSMEKGRSETSTRERPTLDRRAPMVAAAAAAAFKRCPPSPLSFRSMLLDLQSPRISINIIIRDGCVDQLTPDESPKRVNECLVRIINPLVHA